jgi:hypothetical protein
MNVNWQAVAAIASFLAASAAWGTAWLIYRTRPLAIRAIELHSKQFQEKLLPEWKSNLPSCPNLSVLYVGKWDFYQTSALRQMEASSLFNDLPNHVPQGDSLMLLWQVYREEWESLEESRSAFANRVKELINEAARRVGLQGIGSAKDRNCIIEEHFPEHYYGALHELAQNRTGSYEALRKYTSELKVIKTTEHCRVEEGGSVWAFVDSDAKASAAIELFRTLVDELATTKVMEGTDALIKEARKLWDYYCRLAEMRQRIQYEIDALIALPLLPNPDCPLLRTATPPLTPNWVRTLMGWLSNHGHKRDGSS